MKRYTFFAFVIAISTITLFAFKTATTGDMSFLTVPSKGDAVKSMLTKGTWKIKSIVSDKACDTDGDGRHTTDIASEMPSCAMDDLLVIQANGKAVFKRFDRCYPEEAQEEEYRWKLTGDDKFILSKGGYETEMLFQYVTEQELVMIIPTEAMGEMYNFKVTYVHPNIKN